MKLKVFNFDTELNLKSKKINIVEIHNITLFRKVIETIKGQSINEETVEKIWVYNNDYKEINSSNIELVLDFFNMFSSIRIVNPIAKSIENNLDESKMEAIQNINIYLNKLATDLLYDLDIDIEHKESYSLADLLSILKVKISEEQNIIDNLFTLIDYLSFFKPNSFLFIVNLKSYLSSEEINEFYNYVLVKQVNIILLEGRASNNMIRNEQKLVIDEDYDDYYEVYT